MNVNHVVAHKIVQGGDDAEDNGGNGAILGIDQEEFFLRKRAAVAPQRTIG